MATLEELEEIIKMLRKYYAEARLIAYGMRKISVLDKHDKEITMAKAVNINPEKEPIPRSWVPRVITGGKEPPSENECWLEKLPVGTVFVARGSQDVYGKLFELMYKGERFYLITMIVDDNVNDLYINPWMWCSIHPDYEILPNPPIEEEEDNEFRTHLPILDIERNRTD